MKEDLGHDGRSIDEILKDATAGLDIEPRYDWYSGASALFFSNDLVDQSFLDELRDGTKPDGYLVGIGAGGIFSLLDAFPLETPPQAVIIADINARVLAAVRIMIDDLKSSETADEFARRFFHQSPEAFEARVKKVGRKDVSIRKGLDKLKAAEPKDPETALRWHEEYGVNGEIDAPGFVLKNFTLLKELAMSGKISAQYVDFFNPDFVNAVRQLPEFDRRINVIYVTNAIDLAKDSMDVELEAFASALALYEEGEKPPIFVSSPKPNFYLRTSTSFEDLLASIGPSPFLW